MESHSVTGHFTGEGLRINGRLLGEDLVKLTNDVAIDAEKTARLFMLPNGSTAHSRKQTRPSNDNAPPGFYFKSQHPWVERGHKNSVGIYSTTNDRGGLFIEGVFIDHVFIDKSQAPEHFGRIAFGLLALTAYELGFGEVTLLAGGGAPKHAHKWGIQGMVGYCVWPKFGFDAPLEPHEVANHPRLFRCKTVSEARALDPDWWDLHEGNGRVMRFDLAPGSASWHTLLHYLMKKEQ